MRDILKILKKQSDSVNFNSVKITLLSPEKILSISYGEVKKPETINYRTFKAERDGLFCAKIFGPTKNYECLCGKYKKLKHRGVVCEKCGVEVTLAKVRRSRMAHIILGTPVAHIWFLRSLPSKISMILNLSLKNVEKVLYYEEYVILDSGNTPLLDGQVLNEEEYIRAVKEYGDSFKIKTGSEAIYELLANVNLAKEIIDVRKEMIRTKSESKFKKLLKRLKIIEAFINSRNKPEWMMLTVLPVLPPDLRPLVPLDGGRFASSDLNDLYRRVINRNNRLKKLVDLNAPDIIIRNEKRMLQEAVDALLDNTKKGKPINGSNKRPLKSLADMIKGKHGRFRQNLLGKRVDYSGRSIIVVGPHLRMGQCGIPRKLALELFKPFVFCELSKRNLSKTIKRSKKIIEKEGELIWDILADVVKQHPVLLNRAPTLHRLGIQAFEVLLIDSKAIQLHPLVCSAFNADFDGDQMAIHIPLTLESQIETKMLMMSNNNILSPANGDPVIVPSQDIILGLYYLSKVKNNSYSKSLFLKNEYELEKAYENNLIGLTDLVKVSDLNGFVKETTLGKSILQKIIPKSLNFDFNKVLTKKDVSNLILSSYLEFGTIKTIDFVDNLKDVGFFYATKAGVSIGLDDIKIPKEKHKIIKLSMTNVKKIDEQYSLGLITKEEKYNKVIDVWIKAAEILTNELMKKISIKKIKDENNKLIIETSFNPIFMMAESGARGSTAQIRQLAGMRGLMAKPDGSIIETPILANFKEGLNILQYFISSHGARKGLADTALKTANSGYLTRRLVDVAQDVVIISHDCETNDGIYITPIVDGGNIIESLGKRIYGRVLQENIFLENDIVISKGTLIGRDQVLLIENIGIEKVYVRSVIKCKYEKGVCSKCYGMDLSNAKLANIGEAVGIIAGQSIGEPGTQLTMRTFHVGGAAFKDNVSNCVQIKNNGRLSYSNLKVIKHAQSKKLISISRFGKIIIFDKNGKEKETHKVPYGAIVNIVDNSYVKTGKIVSHWDPHNYPIISEIDGFIKYVNLIEGVTIKKELDKMTGLSKLKVIDNNKDKDFNDNTKPCIKVVSAKIDNLDKKSVSYFLSPGTVINFSNDSKVNKGDIIAKIPKETSKTKDITGGLPRVADIFEARRPKNPAFLASATGKIKFGKEKKGKKSIIIETKDNEKYEILIPKWRTLNIFENENIVKGETIIEGEYDLHDILDILGIDELIEYVKKNVLDIYRLQGVNINEKHIEIIIRQMLKKGIVIEPGDSHLIYKDIVDISLLKEINHYLNKINKKPVIYKKILLGITKSSLTTESFISSASFQETTKILTEAAISAKRDNLSGIKENVIVGKLIPAGTGFFKR